MRRHVYPKPLTNASTETIEVGSRTLTLELARNARARRYLLRLRGDSTVRVTVPRGGTFADARAFAARSVTWIEAQLLKLAARHRVDRAWGIGSSILVRGEWAIVAQDPDSPTRIRLGNDAIPVADTTADLRDKIELHLRKRATHELPGRVVELAAEHGFVVRRVSVRDQRSRWGSCSRLATISLNWRLVQAPDWVRDYIILHELAHLRHMNHSRRFWAEVKRLCPGHEGAERWLKEHADLMRR